MCMQVCVLVLEAIESAHPGYHTGMPLNTHHHCTSCMKQYRCNEWEKKHTNSANAKDFSILAPNQLGLKYSILQTTLLSTCI